MRKTLCWSVEDFVAKMLHELDGIDNSIESSEELLGIECAMRDEAGNCAFISDLKTAEELAYWEDQLVAGDVFRIVSPQELPAKYPVLVLTFFEDSWDRLGDFSARIIEFVYPEDFIASANKS